MPNITDLIEQDDLNIQKTQTPEVPNVDPAQAPKEPELSLDELWNSTKQDVDVVKVENFGKSTYFSAPDIDRYMSYGTDVYGQLGYSPEADNSKIYNDNTDGWADITRALMGFNKLSNIGITDTFGLGAFKADDSPQSFKKVMDTYGSTREGTAGFWSNTLLSAGYTVGIIKAIAMEEAILLATTGGLGNLATGGEVVRGVSNIWKAWDKASKTRNIVASSIKFGRKIENARFIKYPYKAGKSLARGLNPLGETMHFVKNFNQIKGLNQFQRAFTGAASLARDARKIHMTMSESHLEASLAYDENRERLYDDWYRSHRGEEMSNLERLDIEKDSDNIYQTVYNANIGLIYVTNAIGLNTLFKSMRLTNTAFGLAASGRLAAQKVNNKILFKAVKQNIKNSFKKKISNITLKSSAISFGRASMEGTQEIGQDAIAGYAKRYVTGDERMRGQTYNSMVGAMGDMRLESFMSGFLMNSFAAPTSVSIKQAQNFFVHGGHKSVTSREKWKESRRKDYKDRVKDASLLTDFFNETGSWLNVQGDPSFTVTESQAKMAEASENNDRMTHEDERAEIFRNVMKRVVKNGMEAEVIDYLQDLKKHTVSELNESLNRTDVTEDNIADFRKKFDTKIEAVKEFKKNYDEAQREVNPIDIQLLREDDPQLNEKRMAYYRFEDYRDELMFTKDKIRDYAQRLFEMNKTLTKDGTISNTEVQILLDKDALTAEIITLQADVSADKEYSVAPEELKWKELKLKHLKLYKTALTNFEKLNQNKGVDVVEKVHAEMFEAFNGMINANLKVEDEVSQRVLNRNKFETFWDYLIKSHERTDLQKHANMMLDPDFAVKYMDRTKKVFDDMQKNKESYILKSLNALHEYEVSNDIFEDLIDAGYVFGQEEIDDLIKNGIMPSKLFNHRTHKELNKKEFAEAQAIINKHTVRLKNKHILTSGLGFTTRTKNESDTRVSTELYSQFGKKDTPIPIKDFIESLINSVHITDSEKKILKALLDLDVSKGNITLTESADAPITIEKDGTVVVDVRFSSEDFKNTKTPFEYLATSAILQSHYAKQLKKNEKLMANTISLMKKAREAYIIQFEHESSANLKYFKDPIYFLSESLNNRAFQEFLINVKNTDDFDNIKAESLWKSFSDDLRETLKKGFDFDGSLLNRAVSLSQLALTDEDIDITLKVTPQTTEAEDKKADIEKPTQQTSKDEDKKAEKTSDDSTTIASEIKSLEDKITEIENQDNKGRFKKKSSVNALRVKLRALKDKLKKSKEDSKKPIVPTVGTVTTPQVDDDGNVVINKGTKFEEMPIELKENIATIYLNLVDHSSVPKKTTSQDEAAPDVMRQSQDDFDKTAEERFKIPKSVLERLEEDDIPKINKLLADGNNASMNKAIAAFNNKRLHSQEPSPKVDEEEDVKIKEDSFYVDTKNEANNNVELLEDGIWSSTHEDLNGTTVTLKAESKLALLNLILASYKENGWADNNNNLVGRSFTFYVGEDENGEKYTHRVEVSRARLMSDGNYNILATNVTNGSSSNGKKYNMEITPEGGVLSYTTESGKRSPAQAKDRDKVVLNSDSIITPLRDDSEQTSEVEAKKAEIEKKRQEKLEKANVQLEKIEKIGDSAIRAKVEVYTTLSNQETLDEVEIITFKDGSRKFKSRDGKTGESLLDEKIKKENTTTNEQFIESWVGNLDNTLKKVSEDNNPNKTAIDKINAEYDAKIAALGSQENSEVEDKKAKEAEIKERKEEELAKINEDYKQQIKEAESEAERVELEKKQVEELEKLIIDVDKELENLFQSDKAKAEFDEKLEALKKEFDAQRELDEKEGPLTPLQQLEKNLAFEKGEFGNAVNAEILEESIKELKSRLTAEKVVEIIKEETTVEDVKAIATEESVLEEDVEELIKESVLEHIEEFGSNLIKAPKTRLKKLINKIIKRIMIMFVGGALVVSASAFSYNSDGSGLTFKLENAIENLLPNVQSQWAKRFLDKKGLIDVVEEQMVVEEHVPIVKETPKPEKIFEIIGTVADSYSPSDSLISYRSQWDNAEGFKYIAVPVKKDLTNGFKVSGVVGVAHFLMDASASPEFSFSKNKMEGLLADTSSALYVPTFTNLEDGGVLLKYKQPRDISSNDRVVAPLRQWNFSDIDFASTGRPNGTGFGNNVVAIKTRTGETTHLMIKNGNRGAMGRMSGGSFVFIFNDKHGNTIVRDFAGSINQIEKEGIDITKQYDLEPGALIIGVHDAASFNAKPKAKDGVISADQWAGFHTAGYTGGALLIPTEGNIKPPVKAPTEKQSGSGFLGLALLGGLKAFRKKRKEGRKITDKDIKKLNDLKALALSKIKELKPKFKESSKEWLVKQKELINSQRTKKLNEVNARYKKLLEEDTQPTSEVDIYLKKEDLSKAPAFAQKAISKTVEAIPENVRLEVVKKAYAGITATFIGADLGLTTEQVRSTRTYYGVPFVADKADYKKWKDNITKELNVQQPAQQTSEVKQTSGVTKSSFTEPVDLNEEFTLANLLKLVPDINKFYDEKDIKLLLEMLNNDQANLEDIHKGLEEKRQEDAKVIQQEFIRVWGENINQLTALSKPKVFFRFKQGVKGKEKYLKLSFSKADIILFRQQNPKAEQSSVEDFEMALGSFRLQTHAKAKTLRALGLGFDLDENLQDNIITLIKDIKESGMLSSGVISAINDKLKEIQSSVASPYLITNVSKGYRTIAYHPVRKSYVLKKRLRSSSNQKLADFYGDIAEGSSITLGQAKYLVYEWLLKNKVHPSLPDVKRDYESKNSPWKRIDSIAGQIFDGVVDETPLETDFDGSVRLTERILDEYERLYELEFDLIEEMESFNNDEDNSNLNEEEYNAWQKELALNEYYSSVEFLIIEGLYEGSIDNLTDEQKKLYRESPKESIDETITPVESDILSFQEEDTSKVDGKIIKNWVKTVIKRINTDDVPLQEVIALYRVITKGKNKLSKAAYKRVINVVHNRLTNSDFLYSTVRSGEDILRIGKDTTIEKVQFYNIQTEKETFVKMDEALDMIDEVLENGTEYMSNNIDTKLTLEDSGILKQAYSDVFVNLAETIESVKDIEKEVLKASIIEELNRCK